MSRRLSLLLLALLLPYTALAQDGTLAPTIVPAMGPDGRAYVYHTAGLIGTRGAVIERQTPGAAGWTALTSEPLRPIRTSAAFAEALGDDRATVFTQLQAETARAALTTLRGNRLAAGIYSFLYPSVADALGRRALDAAARPGQSVRYRLRVVDRDGAEAAEPITVAHTYAAREIDPVTELEGEHEETTIRLEWTYPRGRQETDQVYAFRVVRLTEQLEGDTLRSLAVAPLTRNDATDRFAAVFEAEVEIGESETFEIVPTHLTGAQGPARRVTVVLRDQEPPAAVETSADPFLASDPARDAIDVTWAPATEPDAVGYHVYRRSTIARDDAGVRLTSEPLGLDETSFRDSESGSGTWFYAVTALDLSGNESVRSVWASATLLDRVAPAAPTDLEPRLLATGGARVTWTPSASPDADRYFVWRQRAELPGLYRLTDQARTPMWTDDGIDGSGLREGVRYRYAVAAVDSSGNVSDTLFATLAVPDLTPPAAPATLDADLTDDGRIALSWSVSSASDVRDYIVTGQALSDTVDATAYLGSYVDGAGATDQTLRFAVAARDSAGNVGPAATAELMLVDRTAPRSVRGVRAVQTGRHRRRLVGARAGARRGRLPRRACALAGRTVRAAGPRADVRHARGRHAAHCRFVHVVPRRIGRRCG